MFPASRAEFYDIKPPKMLDDVAEIAKNNHLARGLLEGALQDSGVYELSELDEDGADEVIQQMANWVNDSPEPTDDEGQAFYGQDGQAYALRYFQYEFEYCDELNISRRA